MELPIEIIQKYNIQTPESEDDFQVYGLNYNDHFIGINPVKIEEHKSTWNIYSRGGTVISLFKKIHFIHISCL